MIYHDKLLFDNAVDAMFMSTVDGRFIDMNPAYLDLFGMTSAEAASAAVSDTDANPDDPGFTKPQWDEHWAELEAAGELLTISGLS